MHRIVDAIAVDPQSSNSLMLALMESQSIVLFSLPMSAKSDCQSLASLPLTFGESSENEQRYDTL